MHTRERGPAGRSPRQSTGQWRFLAAALVLVAGCGAGSEDSSSGGDVAAQPTGAVGDEGPTCEQLIGVQTATDLFDGIPAVQADDEVGEVGGATLSCIYETDNADDLEAATHLLQLRVWPGAQYYDPDLTYPGHDDLAGVGDDAFVSASGSVSAGYLEGDTAVMLDYTVIDLSASAPSAPARKDAVVALLSDVHEKLG